MMRIRCAWSRLVGATSHANCLHCARDTKFDLAIARLAHEAPAKTPVDADRVLDRALAARGERAVPRWQRPLAVGGMALAAAALGAIITLAIYPASPPPQLAVGAALPLEVPTQIAHAVVTPLPQARVVRSDDAEIRLEHGSVFVDVDPGPHKLFRVRTPRFTVDVLGTAFSVREDGIVVERGAVRVVSTSGVVLAEHVGAGDTWALPPLVGVVARPPHARVLGGLR